MSYSQIYVIGGFTTKWRQGWGWGLGKNLILLWAGGINNLKYLKNFWKSGILPRPQLFQ